MNNDTTIFDIRKSVRYNYLTRGNKMTSINITNARKNLYKLVEEINENSDQVIITNSKGKNAVLMSEDDWNSIKETLYLNSIDGLSESIIDMSKEDLSKGKVYDKDEEW